MTLDHIGIAVRSIDSVSRIYETVLGLRFAQRFELPDERVRVAFLRSGTVDVELLEPLSDTGPLSTFLTKHGPGLHHIAFRVPDLRDAVAAAVTAGCTPVEPAPRLGARGQLIAFLHPSTTGGVLVELVQA